MCYDSQWEFQIFCRLVNSRPRNAILRKFETPIESHSTYKQTDSQTLADTHRHSQKLAETPDTRRDSQTHARMSTVTFDVTFSVQDILMDPQFRKVLREREDSYLDNLAWLDEDLVEKRHQENINWLDQDLNNKINSAAAITIQKYARRMIVKPKPTRPDNIKIWHCGHAPGSGASDELPEVKKARKKRSIKQYEDGLADSTCIIGHRHQQENERGNNTRKQFMKFQQEAKEGDIIFNHCSRLGGLTHYGFFTGEISRKPSPAPEDAGQGWFHSFIWVYEWIPLPEVVKGSGKNFTLYEVTPTTKNGKPTKNYQNYSIPS